MRKYLAASLLVVLSVMVSAFIHSDELINKIISNLEQFRQDFPQEKVYLHTDRHLYAAGESIWFKAYVTAGLSDQLSPLSKTLYVQLLDTDKKVIIDKKLYIEEGLSKGVFDLPPVLSNGSYTLRAYTHWMRNFPETYLFHKKITIQSLDAPKEITQLSSNDIDLQFFPEGGALVEGMRSKVAFKAIGTDGLSKTISGGIYNSKAEQVAELKSLHAGMGSFYLMPEAGENYYAEIKELPGKKVSLPKVNPSGIVLTVTNQENQEDVVVRIQSKLPVDNAEVILVANSKSFPAYIARINLSQPLAFVRIPKSNLLSGITQLVILDQAGNPLNERLIFHDAGRKLQIESKTDKQTYNNRALTKVDVEVKDEAGNPVKAFLSMAVVDRTDIPADEDNSNIVQYLLLNSELKGYIENPGYYFDASNENRSEALDNLLLSQGWSRFVWEELVNDAVAEPKFYIEQGLNILGRLVDNVSKKPIDNGKVMYFNIDGDAAFTRTGKNGQFILNDLVFFDTTDVVLQGQNTKGKKWVKFELDPEIASPEGTGIFNEIIFESDFDEVFARKSRERKNIEAAYNFDPDVMLLDAVSIRAQKIDELEERKIYKGASRTLKVEDIPGAAYMDHPMQILQGRMAGVQVFYSPPNYSVQIRGVGSLNAGTDPLILFDNMPVDITFLNGIPATEIEAVDVFMGAEAAIFGVQGANGVIAFYSRTSLSQTSSDPGIINVRRSGYALAKEFYKPKYDVRLPEHIKPDRRVTLHWEPMLETDENGKVSISYYNHDNEGEIEIRVEGITESGVPGVSNVKYQVRKQ
jgi:hypothetical protein